MEYLEPLAKLIDKKQTQESKELEKAYEGVKAGAEFLSTLLVGRENSSRVVREALVLRIDSEEIASISDNSIESFTLTLKAKGPKDPMLQASIFITDEPAETVQHEHLEPTDYPMNPKVSVKDLKRKIKRDIILSVEKLDQTLEVKIELLNNIAKNMNPKVLQAEIAKLLDIKLKSKSPKNS